jgi:hypothetical protein
MLQHVALSGRIVALASRQPKERASWGGSEAPPPWADSAQSKRPCTHSTLTGTQKEQGHADSKGTRRWQGHPRWQWHPRTHSRTHVAPARGVLGQAAGILRPARDVQAPRRAAQQFLPVRRHGDVVGASNEGMLEYSYVPLHAS